MTDGQPPVPPVSASSRTFQWMARHPFQALAVYLAIVSLFFLFFPQVDLAISGAFFSPDQGFWAQDVPFLRRFRALGPYLVRLVAVVSAAILILKLLLPARRPLLPLRQPLFLITTLILGPGVLVNLILKNNWGRPRPVMVDLFGGSMPYQPVWLPSNWCATNCSFVSGEGSAAMWLVAGLVLLAPKAWRVSMLAVLIPLGLLLSANRVAFGGHFTSDTLLSWGLTLLVVAVVYKFFYQAPPAWLTDEALDERLTRWGRRLHRAAGGQARGITKAVCGFRNRFRS